MTVSCVCSRSSPLKLDSHNFSPKGSVFPNRSVLESTPRTLRNRKLSLEVVRTPLQNSSKLKCEHCEKGYKYRKDLIAHMRMHLGETECQLCGKILARPTNLKRHLSDVHGIHLDQEEQRYLNWTLFGIRKREDYNIEQNSAYHISIFHLILQNVNFILIISFFYHCVCPPCKFLILFIISYIHINYPLKNVNYEF